MNAIVVSDLHIGSRYFQFGIFERFLEDLPADCELILNGDIVDAPYVKMDKTERRILDQIKAISYRQKVVWVRGNHDNGYVPQDFGRTVFKSSHSLEKRLLIAHGDDFDDIMPRSRLFIRAFQLMHNLRVKLGARPIHVAEYAKKFKYLYRVLRRNIALNAVSCAAANGFEAVTCGHTHFPEDFVLDGIRYINTGAWTEFPAYYLHINSEKMVLNPVDPAFVSQGADSIPWDQDEPVPQFIDAALRPAETTQEFRDVAP